MKNQTESREKQEEQVITLRCSKCDKPISPSEAIQTPTGYRCADCVKRQQKKFDTSQPLDAVWGFLIAIILSMLGSLLTYVIGFFTFLLAPAAGVVVAEAVRMVIKKRRSKRVFRLVSVGMILGGLPVIVFTFLNLIARLSSGAFSLFSLLPFAYQILYLVLAVPSAYYRLSGNRR